MKLVSGCWLDSIVHTNLTEQAPIDTTISIITYNELMANQGGATYQWVECNDGPIAGARSQSFTASEDGIYAVYFTVGNCTEYSSCYTISGVGLDENDLLDYEIFPDPANGYINISIASANFNDYSVSIKKSLGQYVFYPQKVKSEHFTIDINTLSSGNYFVEFRSKEESV